MRLLFVEDNDRLAGVVAKGLRAAGFMVDVVDLAEAAILALRTTRYDIVVLDLGLPDADGLVVIDKVRANGVTVPILVLTARDTVEDRVCGLNSGADDYLLKPCAMEELVARLRALLRRPGEVMGGVLEVGNIVFDAGAREALVDDTRISLSRREVGVLEQLLRRTGRVVPKQAIEEALYGFDHERASNSVEVHVHRLRRKLEDAGAGVRIHTLRGLGYLLTEDAA